MCPSVPQLGCATVGRWLLDAERHLVAMDRTSYLKKLLERILRAKMIIIGFLWAGRVDGQELSALHERDCWHFVSKCITTNVTTFNTCTYT